MGDRLESGKGRGDGGGRTGNNLNKPFHSLSFSIYNSLPLSLEPFAREESKGESFFLSAKVEVELRKEEGGELTCSGGEGGGFGESLAIRSWTRRGR